MRDEDLIKLDDNNSFTTVKSIDVILDEIDLEVLSDVSGGMYFSELIDNQLIAIENLWLHDIGDVIKVTKRLPSGIDIYYAKHANNKYHFILYIHHDEARFLTSLMLHK